MGILSLGIMGQLIFTTWDQFLLSKGKSGVCLSDNCVSVTIVLQLHYRRSWYMNFYLWVNMLTIMLIGLEGFIIIWTFTFNPIKTVANLILKILWPHYSSC